ncbi:MAG: hypothetical protein M3271_12365 [Actinomycetota bacterium]|nr:hypothetical protein [Actinomycetota bacterium]
MTLDLGGNVRDDRQLADELAHAGFTIVTPDEASLWRRAYSLGRRMVIQVEAGPIEVPIPGLEECPVSFRIHPIGVIVVRLLIDLSDQGGFQEPYEVNESVAAWRDEAGERFFHGSETLNDPLLQRVTTIQERARPFVDARPYVSRRNGLNTLQLVGLSPTADHEATRQWIREFASFQGNPVGPDGATETADYVHIGRWKDALVCHLGGGQTLAVARHEHYRKDMISSYERTHVLRFWLRTWMDVLDNLGEPNLRTRRLDRDDVRDLSLEHLRLTDLHQNVASALAEVDDRNIPLNSIFGRQLTSTFGRMFEIDGWKSSLLQRLDAAATRSSFIGTVLDREFQLSAQRQSEKLQLLFAGSLAATVMALLPALLSLTHPREPVWPWILTTVSGTLLIWAVTLYLVSRWKIEILLDQRPRDKGE